MKIKDHDNEVKASPDEVKRITSRFNARQRDMFRRALRVRYAKTSGNITFVFPSHSVVEKLNK
jgi:hypothetical protein